MVRYSPGPPAQTAQTRQREGTVLLAPARVVRAVWTVRAVRARCPTTALPAAAGAAAPARFTFTAQACAPPRQCFVASALSGDTAGRQRQGSDNRQEPGGEPRRRARTTSRTHCRALRGPAGRISRVATEAYDPLNDVVNREAVVWWDRIDLLATSAADGRLVDLELDDRLTSRVSERTSAGALEPRGCKPAYPRARKRISTGHDEGSTIRRRW